MYFKINKVRSFTDWTFFVGFDIILTCVIIHVIMSFAEGGIGNGKKNEDHGR